MFDHAKLLSHLHSAPDHNMMMLHPHPHLADSNINLNYTQNHKDSTWGTSTPSYPPHSTINPDTEMAMDMDSSHAQPPLKSRPVLTTNPSRKRSRDQLDRDDTDTLPSNSNLDGPSSGYFDMNTMSDSPPSLLPSHANSYTSLNLALSDRPAKAARSDSHPLPSPFTSSSIPQQAPSSSIEVDAISLRLGISWSSPSPDPDIQSALRGWEKFIVNHFPLVSARIVAKSESRASMLVEGVLLSSSSSHASSNQTQSQTPMPGEMQSDSENAVFLFKDDLSRMRFLGRTMDDVIHALSCPDPDDEDVDGSWNGSGPWGKWVLKRERTPLPTPTQSAIGGAGGGGDGAMLVD